MDIGKRSILFRECMRILRLIRNRETAIIVKMIGERLTPNSGIVFDPPTVIE